LPSSPWASAGWGSSDAAARSGYVQRRLATLLRNRAPSHQSEAPGRPLRGRVAREPANHAARASPCRMSAAVINILAFVVAISVLVAVHELGHFLVGRWCGMKVLRYSIGF